MPRRKTKDEFVKESNKIHNNVYDYSKVEYTNNRTKVCIICPIHGEFFMRPDDHLHGHSYPKCSKHYHYTTKDFIERAKEVHSDKYDYSKVEYVNAYTKVCIICPKHGEFWQNHGCPYCKASRLEKNIRKYLFENNIIFEEQKRFDWLGLQSLDFYLPKYNIAIECQGIQHYEPINYFGGKSGFEETVKRDNKKYELCKKNNINILYYSELNLSSNNIINSKDKLLEKILMYEP